MCKGKFYDNIDKDPRKSKNPDEKIDIGSSMDAEGAEGAKYNRQKSMMIGQTAAKTTEISEGANKVVNKLLQRARDAKESLAKRKAEEAAEAAKDEPKSEEIV